jgi:hypothetical protein
MYRTGSNIYLPDDARLALVPLRLRLVISGQFAGISLPNQRSKDQNAPP